MRDIDLILQLDQAESNSQIMLPVKIERTKYSKPEILSFIRNILNEKRISSIVLSNWSCPFFDFNMEKNLDDLFKVVLCSEFVKHVRIDLDCRLIQSYIEKLHDYVDNLKKNFHIEIDISHPRVKQEQGISSASGDSKGLSLFSSADNTPASQRKSATSGASFSPRLYIAVPQGSQTTSQKQQHDENPQAEKPTVSYVSAIRLN